MYTVLEHGGATPVFLDTSAIVAYFYSTDQHHSEIKTFFRGVRDDIFRARPLYTNEYVIDETLTTLVSRGDHSQAVAALNFIQQSNFISVLTVTPSIFDAACSRFTDYTAHELSFTDHVIGIHAREKSVEFILSFDQDFEILGLTTLPESP